MSSLVLILIFIVATICGYKLIKNVPSLLHTPLMSGMNALSGITILGAITTVSIIANKYNIFLGSILGGSAIILAMVNVAGGFGVTHRMLKMFIKKGAK